MVIAFGSCVLDLDRRELLVDGEVVDMQRQVFDVLAYLAANAERVVTKTELLDNVWGDRFVSDSAVSTRIKEARRAVGDSGSTQAVIKTVHGVGYRFVADADHSTMGHQAGEESQTAADSPVPPSPSVAGLNEGAGRSPGAEISVPRTIYADRSGASIAYQRFGDGPELVLICGLTTNVELLWEHPAIAKFLRILGSFATVTVFDKRGVGCSERLPAEQIPGLDVRADDLVAVMDHAGIDRAFLLGTSEGGALATLFAATHPERVQGLALHGAWANCPPSLAESAKLTEEHWGKGWIYGALGPSLAATKEGRRLLSRYERQSATPRLAASIVEMLIEIDVTGILSAIRVPTVVIHSPADEWVPYEQAEIIHAGIPNSVLLPLVKPDHYLFSCDPDEMAGPLRQLIEGDLGSLDNDPDDHQLATVLRCHVGHDDDDDDGGQQAAPGEGAAAGEPDRWNRSAVSAIRFSRGEVVTADGDGNGLTALFDSPGRAIKAAGVLVSSAEQAGLVARCGLHCAEVRRRGDDVAGVGVEIGAAIAGQAGAGEVWVSRTVTDLVAGNGLRFSDEGEHRLDAIDQPWHLYSLDAVADVVRH